MLVLQKFLIIINEAIGYFEVAGWVNVLSQNGQFRGSDHLLLGYAKMIGQDPPTPPPIKNNKTVPYCNSVQHPTSSPGLFL